MEQDKFLGVIKENQSLIYKICYSYCSDVERQKDLQQEILIQLWQSFSRFDGRVKISTWIYRIALNTAISYYRKDIKQRIPKVHLDAEMISLHDSLLDSDNDDKLALLRCFILELNDVDKALMLLYLDDVSYKDIADILGISISNVATKISRIKRKLKTQFTNYG